MANKLTHITLDEVVVSAEAPTPEEEACSNRLIQPTTLCIAK